MLIASYQNGNANIKIHDDGTRIIEFEDELKLDSPLNIDIRVSTKCSFGLNPSTGKAFCSFCHEEAKTDGFEADYEQLKEKLISLPQGIELAIGANNITQNLFDFISWAATKKYIVNLTINQGHIRRDILLLRELINKNLISGLGVSYRSGLKFDVPEEILSYSNTVFHVITGIDKFDEIKELYQKGVKKVLLLGEKNFGFNLGNVDLTTRVHKEWYWWVGKLFNIFDVVSFDNLALEQLKLSRYFNNKNWNVFNQGEHSMYLDAANKVYKPSSRSNDSVDWNAMTVREYFNNYINI